MKRPSLRRLLPQLAALLLSLTPLVANGIGQVCYVGNDRSTPNEDLIDHGDQTVSHSKTGLMWKQCEEGLSGAGCTGSFLFLDWGQALGAATSANINKFAFLFFEYCGNILRFKCCERGFRSHARGKF